ncbi:MAG: zf-HC2 domain-containing protein [Candidatus Aminicenantes bacterium]|nr:zf-HC2 domain-containing protein [Candidatus Aminicenantes bacterium]
MNCKDIENLFSAYIEEELSPEDRSAVEEHLKTCRECALLYSSFKETTSSLAEFPELEVSSELMRRLHGLPMKKKRFFRPFEIFLKPSFQPILAVASIILTLFSFYFFNPDREQFNRNISRQIHLGYSKMERFFAKAESFTENLDHRKDKFLASLKNSRLFGGSQNGNE